MRNHIINHYQKSTFAQAINEVNTNSKVFIIYGEIISDTVNGVCSPSKILLSTPNGEYCPHDLNKYLEYNSNNVRKYPIELRLFSKDWDLYGNDSTSFWNKSYFVGPFGNFIKCDLTHVFRGSKFYTGAMNGPFTMTFSGMRPNAGYETIDLVSVTFDLDLSNYGPGMPQKELIVDNSKESWKEKDTCQCRLNGTFDTYHFSFEDVLNSKDFLRSIFCHTMYHSPADRSFPIHYLS